MAFAREWKWRRLLIRQHDATDCGPACLASICSYYKKFVAVAKIRQLAKTDPGGTTLLGLVDAATLLGFEAKGVKADAAEDVPGPAIAHVIVDGHLSHYVVLIKASKNKVTLMDPAYGKIRYMRRNEFEVIWTGVVLVLAAGESFVQEKPRSTLKKIAALAEPFRGSLLCVTVFAAIVSLLGITISIYVREIVDVILVRKNTALLNIASLIAVVVLIIQGVASIVKGGIVLTTGTRITARLIMTYCRHVLRLPQSFFDSMRVGEMLSRINDAVKITAFIHEVAVNVIVDGLIVLTSISAMFYFNWKIGLLVISVIPLYGIIYIISNRINRHWQRKITAAGADFDSSLVETLSSVSTINVLSLENHFSKKVFTKLEGLLSNVLKASSKQLKVQTAADLLSKLVTVLLLWIGSYYVMKTTMTTGELMLFYTLFMWFTAPLLYLLGANRLYNDAVIAADRLFEILELKTEEYGSVMLHDKNVTLRFRNVWFAYGYNDFVLKGVDLLIQQGTILGICGKSGSGKSTIASLLLRRHKPATGDITINGVDIFSIDRKCFTDLVSVVTQKADLFVATLKENITIGRPYDEEKLKRICGKLGIEEFALAHPAALDMMLTEQGNNLSGGQRQRVAIARAIYRDAPVLILDEATAAIDAVSEEKIMQTIEWYKNSGNTVIIIAHSESTLKICNNIVILEDGVIK